ncbi:MAG: DUF3006 domain-containing protein [Peptococcaceae bacterium]|jgi:hypothetical protein|nr:DUF3006 domain-containing protein [Peptococcaceae bacterium]
MRLIIDRFEGGVVLCETPTGEIITLDKKGLPPDAREGDVIDWREKGVRVLPKATARRRRKLDEMFRRLWK